MAVIPPWSHDTEVKFDPAGRERFRKAHGLDGKFVVMYSGNHSPVHPLDTLLDAAQQLASDPEVVFCFIGGGSEWRKIKEKAESRKQKAEIPLPTDSCPPSSVPRPPSSGQEKAASGTGDFSVSAFQRFSFSNILCLPYQPLDQLSGSLSAGDLHVVVMGDPFVGLVHPCKIYNILNVGAPVLYIGPRVSHISEIADAANGQLTCLSARHGDVAGVVKQIQQLRSRTSPTACQPAASLRSLFSKGTVLPKLITELESA